MEKRRKFYRDLISPIPIDFYSMWQFSSLSNCYYLHNYLKCGSSIVAILKLKEIK